MMFNAQKVLWGQPIFLPDLVLFRLKPNKFDFYVCILVDLKRQALHVLGYARKITLSLRFGFGLYIGS